MLVLSKLRKIDDREEDRDASEYTCPAEGCNKSCTHAVSGEEDSFGVEWNYFCEEHAQATKEDWNEVECEGTCKWCKTFKTTLKPYRDWEEGNHGPVYDVCQECRERDIKQQREELAEYERENGPMYEEDDGEPYMEELADSDDYDPFVNMEEDESPQPQLEIPTVNEAQSIINVVGAKLDEIIARDGFAHYSGGGFTYTVGLSTVCGYELLLNLKSDLSPEYPSQIVVAFAKHFKANPLPVVGGNVTVTTPVVIPEYINRNTGLRLRIELIEIDLFSYIDNDGLVNQELLNKGLFPRFMIDHLIKQRPRPLKFVQIVIGDKNNIMPWEAGYDAENWPQFVYKKLVDIPTTIVPPSE